MRQLKFTINKYYLLIIITKYYFITKILQKCVSGLKNVAYKLYSLNTNLYY